MTQPNPGDRLNLIDPKTVLEVAGALSALRIVAEASPEAAAEAARATADPAAAKQIVEDHPYLAGMNAVLYDEVEENPADHSLDMLGVLAFSPLARAQQIGHMTALTTLHRAWQHYSTVAEDNIAVVPAPEATALIAEHAAGLSAHFAWSAAHTHLTSYGHEDGENDASICTPWNDEVDDDTTYMPFAELSTQLPFDTGGAGWAPTLRQALADTAVSPDLSPADHYRQGVQQALASVALLIGRPPQ